tara:strand:- start:1185 stop:1463 length:279 start_codon:yes stop_codon:yes gene_type:complete
MRETQESLIEAVDLAYRNFLLKRGLTAELTSPYDPYSIRGMNPYSAYGIPPQDLEFDELMKRAKSRKDRLTKVRLKKEKELSEAERSAIYQS